MKKVKEGIKDGESEDYVEGNARFLRWLIDQQLEERIQGFPVVCVKESCELTYKKPLLMPHGLWSKETGDYVDLFPSPYIMHDRYSDVFEETHWQFLEERGFIYKDVLCQENVETLDDPQVEGSLSEEEEHKISPAVAVSQIAFLEGHDGLLDTVRRSKSKARRFLEFILKYVIKTDRSWEQLNEVDCSCKRKHRVYPTWMTLLKTREWVPVGKSKEDKPSPQNVAALLDEELKRTILDDSDCAKFLLKLGIGVSDLLRIGVAEEKRFELNQLSARIYGSSDPMILESISVILDNADIRESVIMQREEKEKVSRNQTVGRTVESLLKEALSQAGIQVKRTGVGSDYEVESDFIEDGQEQILEACRYLIEVKSTSGDHVRMTLPQGKKAVGIGDVNKYVLCVAKILPGEINEMSVRNNSKFVIGIGTLLRDKVNDATELKKLEKELSPSSTGDVELEIVGSGIRFKIGNRVWQERGIAFDEFVERIKSDSWTATDASGVC
jgi:hypothetical protein